ncbi:MAG: glycosyltransferase family 2 protein [Solirubrobacteraceae bacterium]
MSESEPVSNGDLPRVSVVISTHNRSATLQATLRALAHQDVSPDHYEVIVVDDGSTDETSAALAQTRCLHRLKTIRLERNRGVSAGRNAGIRVAQGKWLILLSDDMLVGPEFVRLHVATQSAHPGTWVGGAFEQLPGLRSTPFGRYLDRLERQFDAGRRGASLADGLVELLAPSARCLSMPRVDLDRTGPFDEQFRVTCEDQDLCQRAAAIGVRFVLNPAIACVHNDASAEVSRYCRFQRNGAADTVRLVRKYPELHGDAELVGVNGPAVRTDRPRLLVAKLVKQLGSANAALHAETALVRVLERAGASDRVLFWTYRKLIGLYTFRGWREGLRES